MDLGLPPLDVDSVLVLGVSPSKSGKSLWGFIGVRMEQREGDHIGHNLEV